MRSSIGFELAKLRMGPALVMLLTGGIALCALTSYGYSGAPGGVERIPGEVPSALVVQDMVRSWMMMFLFSALAGGFLVTRELSSGTIARTALIVGSRKRLFATKAAASLVVGCFFAVVAAVVCAATTAYILRGSVYSFAWTTETTKVALGVLACTVFAAPWGTFIGWLTRSSVGMVAVLVLLTLGLEPGIQRIVPDVAKYFMTIAMSGVYRDTKADLLPTGLALLVIIGWLAVLGAVAYRQVRRRDLV